MALKGEKDGSAHELDEEEEQEGRRRKKNNKNEEERGKKRWKKPLVFSLYIILFFSSAGTDTSGTWREYQQGKETNSFLFVPVHDSHISSYSSR